MMEISTPLVRRLVSSQFPQWANLPIRPVMNHGWDNRTFRLGEHKLIRLPSAAEYAPQVKKEHCWLPKLAPSLPLQIPIPVAIGEPAEGYPWQWSIYRWLEGEPASSACIKDLSIFAASLAQFLIALQQIDTAAAPSPGPDNFYRGGSLQIYDAQTRQAIHALKGKINTEVAMDVWETGCATIWHQIPVWVHGDVSAANLLTQEAQLSAVIDFGMLAAGDPACDLVIAWTLFEGQSREVFRSLLPFDKATWERGRAWALWKALMTVSKNWTAENTHLDSWRVIDEVLREHNP